MIQEQADPGSEAVFYGFVNRSCEGPEQLWLSREQEELLMLIQS